MRDSFSAQNNSLFREKTVAPSLYLEKRYHYREIIHYFSFGTWTLTLKVLQLLFGLGICFPGFGVLQIPKAISCLYILLEGFWKTQLSLAGCQSHWQALRSEDMRLQLNNSSLHFLFLSIWRLGWRGWVLLGRAIYLFSEQEWVDSPLWAAWDRERLEGSYPPHFLSSVWLKHTFFCPQPSSQFSSYRLRDHCSHQGVLAGEPEQTPRPAAGCPRKDPQLYTWLLQFSDSNFSFG